MTGLYLFGSPLSWDVESDMELVLSDMTESSERSCNVELDAFLLNTGANTGFYKILFFTFTACFCFFSRFCTCVAPSMDCPLTVGNILVELGVSVQSASEDGFHLLPLRRLIL